MNFDYADVAIRDMNRRNLRSFGKLKQLKFDEVNVLGEVKTVYRDSIRIAKRRFRQIAWEAFIAAMLEAGKAEQQAEEEAQDFVTNDWILDMLEDFDPVTLYRFSQEAERKQIRLFEALMAAHNKGAEVDKALRLWTLQIGHYAERSVIDGTVSGYKAAGVKQVRWVAVDDEKTCMDCEELDGEIFDIDKVPDRPHYHCRCVLRIVK